MDWDAYVVFSILSGVVLLGVMVFSGPGWGKNRLGSFAGGLIFIGYGIFVGTQDSGTWVFPIWIFVIPFLAGFYLIHKLVQRARKRRIAAPRAIPGTPLPRCPQCGHGGSAPSQSFCRNCGTPLSPPYAPPLHSGRGMSRRKWVVAGVVAVVVVCAAIGAGVALHGRGADASTDYEFGDEYSPEVLEMQDHTLTAAEARDVISSSSLAAEKGDVIVVSDLTHFDYWAAADGTVNGQWCAWVMCRENSGTWFVGAAGGEMEYFQSNSIPDELRDWVAASFAGNAENSVRPPLPDPSATVHPLTEEEVEHLVRTDKDVLTAWIDVYAHQTFGEWAAAGIDLYRGGWPSWVFKWKNGEWTVFYKDSPHEKDDFRAAGVPEELIEWLFTEGLLQ